MQRRNFSHLSIHLWLIVSSICFGALLAEAEVLPPITGKALQPPFLSPEVCTKAKSTAIGVLCEQVSQIACMLARPYHVRQACSEWDKLITSCSLGALCGFATGGGAGITGALLNCLKKEGLTQQDFLALSKKCADAMVPSDGPPCVCSLPSELFAPCQLNDSQRRQYCASQIDRYVYNCGGGVFGFRCRCSKVRQGDVYRAPECQNAYQTCLDRTSWKCRQPSEECETDSGTKGSPPENPPGSNPSEGGAGREACSVFK
jgi:hypothetical protein